MTTPASVLLLEDDAVVELRPLVRTRPAFELRTGVFNLRERVALAFPGVPIRARVRPALQPVLRESLPELAGALDSGPVLVLNARLRGDVAALRDLASELSGGGAFCRDDVPAAAWLSQAPTAGATLDEMLSGLPLVSSRAPVELFEHPWDLIHANGDDLCRDFRTVADGDAVGRMIFGVDFEEGAPAREWMEPAVFGPSGGAILYPGVHLMAEENIRFAPGARVDSGCVLDAENGPILLGRGVHVHANSTIVGPAYLGPGSVVNPGTRLREGTSLGTLCKVGGEVEEAVFLDLSNKQHDGFVGHAYLGSWVNLGAGTSASDLKNNYGVVKVDQGKGLVSTGQRFVGPIVGDHAKTGINTMLNTGTVVGVAANVFGGDFPPRFIPSFSWGGAGGLTEYRPDAAMETARMVMSRRKARWTPAYEELLRHVFQETAFER